MSDQIEDILRRKADLERRRERLLGKLESARESLEKVYQELEEMGVEPSEVSNEIQRLLKERDEKIALYNNTLNEADEILTRIEGRLNTL